MKKIISKETWSLVANDYETGNYVNCRELADRHQVSYVALRIKISREHWKERAETFRNKVKQNLEEKAVSRADQYLERAYSRAKKYEKMLDASQDHSGSKLPDGTPLLAAADLDIYTRAEQRIHELAKSALRIPAVASVDITSKGLSVGESIVTAIEKLRANPSAIVHVSSEDVDRVLEMEVVDDPPKQ